MKSSSKSSLSQRMLPACSPLVTGLKSPPQTALSNPLQLSMPHSASKVSEHNARSPVRPVYNSYRDGAASKVAAALAGAYSSSEPSEAAVVATLAYARMQPEQGFPYGISGVAMPSYNYGSELYNYASNGFPRKSRICSYCSKVFTRSTTRRYHEKRCPLLRAAGSLAKGDTSSTGVAATAGAGIGGDDGVSSGGSNVNIPSQHPPLLAMNRESPSPLQTSSATSSASTSAVVPASSSAHSLNPSLYSAYVSQSMYSNVPVTSTSSAPHLSPVIVAGNSSVDQNRNSVVSAKQEAGQLVNINHQVAGAAPESTVMASPVRDVDSVHTRVQTRVEYGQHFSPLSTASLSPSIGSPSVEDEAESDAAEDLTVRPSMLMYSSPPVVSNGAHSGINSTSGKPLFLKDYTYDNPSHSTSQESYKLVWGSQAGHLPSLGDKADLIGKSTDIPSDEDGSSVRDEKGSTRYDCDTVAQGVDYGSCRMDVDEADSTILSEKECGICQQQFQSSRSLHAHMQVHQKYNPNACRICGQRFLRTSMRMAHERIHSVENPFYCVVCGLHFARKFALRQHVIRQHVNAKDRAPLACRHCQKSAMSVVHLLQHLLTHSIPKHERTSLLYLRFARPVFSSHKEEAALEMAPPRSVDSRISDDSPNALLSEPPPLIQVRRSPVSVAGSEESVLANGTSTASGARDMEWCRLCDKEYPKSFMRFHEKAHADQKPYECPTCKKRFGYKNNMKSHMKLHAGIKPYQCHICGAKFTRGSTLRRHARRHGINTETIWDLFVSKGQASRQGSLASRAVALNQAQAHDAPSNQGQGQAAALPPSAEVMTTGATPSRTLKPESSGVIAGSCDILPSGKSFDMTGFSPSPTLAQNLFASYQGLPAVTQSLYQPYMATAQFLNYAAGFSSVNVQEVQSDALNLSLPDKHRRSTSRSGSSTQDQTPSVVNHSQGPVYHSTTPTDGGSLSCHDLIPDDDDNEKRSTKMEQCMAIESRHADSDMGSSSASAVLSQVAPEVRDSLGSIKPLCHSTSKDCGVQVTLCCARITPAGGSSMEDFSSTLGSSNGPLDMSATSPSRPVAAATDSFQHETIAMLMSAGRLFRCPYCDCYFTEYAMYHVHQKLHQPDQPFTCRTCGENCHDRVYFSLHICDHLR